MLSQLERLSFEVDGRYATDAELQFLADYVQSFHGRSQAYLRLQELESTLVQQAYIKLRSIDPALLDYNDADVGAKWKQDTIRVLRYTAVAVLMDDSNTFKERFLLWFQTIMKAFGVQQSCNVTYQILQDLVKQNFSPPQAQLICPILELTRQTLGAKRLPT
jgi:hypothetical protein